MRGTRWLSGALFLLGCSTVPVFGQQIGKFVPIQAGSEVDHALTEINAAMDPDSVQNAMNMIRAASEKGDSERLVRYGEKAQGILKRYKEAPAPAGTQPQVWEEQKARTLESNKDGIAYIQQAVYNGALQAKDAGKRAGLLTRFAQTYPDSPYANQALGVAAASYQQAQNAPKMLEVAQGIPGKDPNHPGMVLPLFDYYCDKADQLAKAETYARKAIS